MPAVNELTVQLLLNVGRGAKGILWFTLNKNVGERHLELRTTIQGLGRVLALAQYRDRFAHIVESERREF